MITLILVTLGLSGASAQTLASETAAQCDSFTLEKLADQTVSISRGNGIRAQLKTNAPAMVLGRQLLNGGIDVQSFEPVDAVYIARKEGSPAEFEVVYKDHRVTETESVPTYSRYSCNAAANQILNGMVAAALN